MKKEPKETPQSDPKIPTTVNFGDTQKKKLRALSHVTGRKIYEVIQDSVDHYYEKILKTEKIEIDVKQRLQEFAEATGFTIEELNSIAPAPARKKKKATD